MKTILFETNFNGKLDCNRFAHVDLAPEKPVPQAVLDNTILCIKVKDNSHAPVTVKVDCIIPVKLTELSNVHTWPSHGMDTAEFMEWQNLRKPGLNRETPLAVYYYKKVDPPDVN